MSAMGLEDAQILALKALAHVLHDRRTRDALLVQTGVEAADLREHAYRTEFLAGIMTFVLDDEGRARAFCTAESVDPGDMRQAHAVLSGKARESKSTE